MIITSSRQNKVTLRCLAILLTLAFLVLPLSGCANLKRAEKAGTETFTIHTVETVKIEVPMERVNEVVRLENQLVILGTSGGASHLVLADLEGKALTEIKDAGAGIEQPYPYGLAATEDGGFAVLLGRRASPGITENLFYTIARYTASGEHSEDVALQSAPQGVLHGFVLSPEGEAVCWDLKTLYLFDQSGKLRVKNSPSGYELLSLHSVGGELFTAVNKGAASGVCAINTNTGDLGELIAGEGLFLEYTTGSGSGDKLFLNGGEGAYMFRPEEGDFAKLFSWSSASLNGNDIRCLISLEEDEYFCVSDGALYRVSTEQEETERERVVVGVVGDRSVELYELVDLFNRNSRDYYAEIEYYDIAELTRLKTELIAGTAPDVLEISRVSMDMDISPGKYVDLLPYIDRDDSISRDDFAGSLLNALLIDGQLVSIPAFFEIYTITGRTADVGAEPGWDMADLERLLETKGAGYRVFSPALTSGELMLWISSISMSQFVDWSNLACDFTDDTFISLLNFCKSVPTEFNPDEYTSDYAEDILLAIQSIQTPQWLETLKKHYAGADFTFIGFPNSVGNNGSYYTAPYASVQLTIPGRAENKEGAWAFIREMIGSDYQSREASYYLPILETELMSRLDEALSKEDTILTQEDADRFLQFLNETEIFQYSDNMLREIILSEAIPFFKDEISAEEAARRIDSRAGLYLAEKAH